MVKRYIGGLISATQAVANNVGANGIFNLTNKLQLDGGGNWPQ